jgi:hypothetical protein
LYLIKEFALDLTEIGADSFKKRIDELASTFLAEIIDRKLNNAVEEAASITASAISSS